MSALRRAAAFPGSVALTAMLDVALWRQLPADVRARLLGKRVEIVVTDWNLRLRFVARRAGFLPQLGLRPADLSIAAQARDFGALAAGDADADTLYFGRRLLVEGDTELALMVKNTLDALEQTRGRAFARRIHRVASAIRANPEQTLT